MTVLEPFFTDNSNVRLHIIGWFNSQDALNANKIEPKENMLVLARLVKEMENVTLDLERHLALIASLEEGLETKADKADLAASF